MGEAWGRCPLEKFVNTKQGKERVNIFLFIIDLRLEIWIYTF